MAQVGYGNKKKKTRKRFGSRQIAIVIMIVSVLLTASISAIGLTAIFNIGGDGPGDTLYTELVTDDTTSITIDTESWASELHSVTIIQRNGSEHIVATFLSWDGIGTYRTVIYDCDGLCPDVIRWE